MRPPFRTSPARRAAPIMLWLGIAGFFACREASEPFRPVDREPPADLSLLRLTYGAADDRTPTWSPDGDSVYFTTSRYEVNPLAPRTLLAVADSGMGSVVPVLHNVNEGTSGRATWTSAPAVAANGRRIAFMRVPPLLPDAPCVGTRICPMYRNLSMVRLTTGELHVRSLDATHGIDDDIVLNLEFLGHSEVEDPTARNGVLTISEYHPFQYQFETRRISFFRPTWNPFGTEIVVSDGLTLLRWQLGANFVAVIPGTDDGMMPAWSPNGEWLAYTRYQRTGSTTFDCDYFNPVVGNVDCEERRIVHFTDPPVIVLIRPDGSEERILGQGTDPAWSPDGSFIFASADVGGSDMIVRIALDDGATTLIPRTEGGIEPAVSPDGRRLAFARSDAFAGPATYDIWVVDLP